MGVIKKSSISGGVSPSIEDVLEDIGNEVDDQEPVTIRPKKIRHRTSSKPHPVGGTNVAGGKSGKKKKRVDNSNYLLSLADPDEIQDLSIRDFIPQSVSVFTELFIHRDTIQIWHDFINCTMENEDWFQKHACMQVAGATNGTGTEDKYDKRNDHPAYSAVKCFHKIDGGIRLRLRKKHVPIGTLMHLEQELVTFFVNRPSSIYHCQLPNSFERLMIHALSQYLDLSSLSYDRSGTRWTRVKNKHDSFFLPTVLLSSYLERRHYNNTVH